MTVRSSFQHPQPGRIYAAWVQSHNRARWAIIAELRVAPGKQARTSYGIAKHGRHGAEKLARAWLKSKRLEQAKNFEKAFAEWQRAKGSP